MTHMWNLRCSIHPLNLVQSSSP